MAIDDLMLTVKEVL